MNLKCFIRWFLVVFCPLSAGRSTSRRCSRCAETPAEICARWSSAPSARTKSPPPTSRSPYSKISLFPPSPWQPWPLWQRQSCWNKDWHYVYFQYFNTKSFFLFDSSKSFSFLCFLFIFNLTVLQQNNKNNEIWSDLNILLIFLHFSVCRCYLRMVTNSIGATLKNNHFERDFNLPNL